MSDQPNVIPFGKHQALDPETNILLGRAFDAAWLKLGAVTGAAGTDEMRTALARRIIDMAQRGERDIAWLRDDALRHLRRTGGDTRAR